MVKIVPKKPPSPVPGGKATVQTRKESEALERGAVEPGAPYVAEDEVMQLGAPPPPTSIEDLHLRAFIFGYSGCGKSHFLASIRDCPEMLPALILSADGGAITLERLLRGVKSVTMKRTRTLQELDAALNLIPKGQYKSLCLDGIKAVYDMILRALAPPLKVGTLFPFTKESWHSATIRDRGTTLDAMVNLALWLVAQPVHVIISGLADDTVDETGSKTGQIGIMLPGKLRRLFPAEFDLVGYLEAKRKTAVKNSPQVHTLQLAATGTVPEAKTRYVDADQALAGIEEPTCAKLLEHAALLFEMIVDAEVVVVDKEVASAEPVEDSSDIAGADVTEMAEAIVDAMDVAKAMLDAVSVTVAASEPNDEVVPESVQTNA